MNLSKKLSLLTSALSGLAILTFSPAARAQELVFNGGFELRTGGVNPSALGWSVNGQTYDTPNSPHSGNWGIQYASIGYDAPLTQNLNTTVGATEVISFWQQQAGGKPDEVTLDFGGVRLLTMTDLSFGPWTQHTVTTTATSASTVLAFGLRQDGGYSYLDDVSVVQTAPAAVPEPGSLVLLMGIGTTGIGFLAHRRGSARKVV